MQRRLFLGLVPLALLAAGCGRANRPPDQFEVSTSPVETAAEDAFEYRVGDLDAAGFAARLTGVNTALGSYKTTIATPAAGTGTIETMQVLREVDDQGVLRLHAWGEVDGGIQELITVGDVQWLKVEGEWQQVAGHLVFGGEGDKVEIFASMLTRVGYQGVDEYGHRFVATMDVTGYENQDTHDHDHGGGEDGGEHDDHDHDHEGGPVEAEVTFWTDAGLRVVRITHALDDRDGDDEKALTIETRVGFGQVFNITAPI